MSPWTHYIEQTPPVGVQLELTNGVSVAIAEKSSEGEWLFYGGHSLPDWLFWKHIDPLPPMPYVHRDGYTVIPLRRDVLLMLGMTLRKGDQIWKNDYQFATVLSIGPNRAAAILSLPWARGGKPCFWDFEDLTKKLSEGQYHIRRYTKE